MQTADLHFHTSHSDGKKSVEEVVRLLMEARKVGLSIAVLTDHDGVYGYEAFANAVSKYWTPICASELSCGYFDSEKGRERELHLLVYGLNPNDSELQKKFQNFKSARRERFFKICEKLREGGYAIDAETIARNHSGSLGRPHIAEALVDLGAVRSRQEAFDKFLNDQSPFNVKKWRLPLDEAVNYAKRHGARTSIAHPGQYGFREAQLKDFKDIGVDAIEIVHPRHTQDDRNYYEDAAKRFGFWMTGGSDFHGVAEDQRNGVPTLGRTEYPLSWAKKFLGDLL